MLRRVAWTPAAVPDKVAAPVFAAFPMKKIAHEGRPESEPPAEAAASESVRASRFRLSLTGWLAFGLGGIVVVFLAGNLLVQRSTRLATENVTRVQQELEPLARRARALSDAISNYERAVLSYLKPGAPTDHAGVDSDQARMQAATHAPSSS